MNRRERGEAYNGTFPAVPSRFSEQRLDLGKSFVVYVSGKPQDDSI